MDIGGMGGQYDEYDGDWSDWWSAEDGGEKSDYDVNGIEDAICYKCGGRGHVATTCPSKGKGKGGKGKGTNGVKGVQRKRWQRCMGKKVFQGLRGKGL